MTVRNDELMSIFDGEYQRRWEPNFAIANAIPTLSSLPALRGLWPMSGNNTTPGVLDISGNGLTLTNVTGQHTISGLAPCIRLDGANDYLWAADAANFDILGN